ncbi:MAG: HAMP domain-containing sensor histidine kinase [Acidobacteria bacterium]|nr:HAMP domain-containing sensor histidine kinase [Acidobacteriota bacterium]MDA1237026.1 HAMP domain-containing sensor histidine kinase [Acidobacteriota bacterium]
MVLPGHRRRSVALAIVFGILLIAVAVGLNVSWIVVNWRTGLLLVAGVLSFLILIAGLTVNTVFLVREIRRNEQHDAFINAVTHELKTPVASIRLYLQTLQQRDIDPEKRQEFLGTMLADTDRLQSTIDQVLLAGKTGSGRKLTHRSDVDLAELIDDCVTVASRRHGLAGGELEVQNRIPSGESLVVDGEPEELRAAIGNLLDNAVKYSGETIKVLVELEKLSGRRAAIRVTDTGVGITNDELKRVFKRFYRIPGVLSTRVKGTGLGLSIVLSVAKRHGGKAYVESQGKGKGSAFTIELPLKA